MAFQIESQDWPGEDDPMAWLPCLSTPAESINVALAKLNELIVWDLSVDKVYPYRIVEV
jgi:hypothetical protein